MKAFDRAIRLVIAVSLVWIAVQLTPSVRASWTDAQPVNIVAVSNSPVFDGVPVVMK